MPDAAAPTAFWARPPGEIAAALGVSLDGLSPRDATARLALHGVNEIHPRATSTRMAALWRQVRSPLVLLLVFAATASVLTGEWADAMIVGVIVFASVGIGYRREHAAERAIALLLARIEISATVLRDGTWAAIPVREVVPGDIVRLAAGCLVPADALLIDAAELHVNESSLTGESFPVAKRVGVVPATSSLQDRRNVVYFGTNVRSGSARALVVETGGRTAFGAIAGHLAARAPETEFERGLRRFGMLLLISMLVMVLVVFAINVMLHRPAVETLLFSIALAVGLSPELLPAIIGINLSRAAQSLAGAGMLCRRLDAIENLGSMSVLCTDKTGTLTEGVARVEGAYDSLGVPSDEVMALAATNAALQTGLANPIDAALIAARPRSPTARKLVEIPYDFMRKRLSVIVEQGGEVELISKGAFTHILEVCTRARGQALDATLRDELTARYDAWCQEGIRVIAVARGRLSPATTYGVEAERDLELAGFVTFIDPPKPDAAAAIRDLARLGVTIKMISGDSRLVACHVAGQVGLDASRALTGVELDAMTDIALVRSAAQTSLFVEVDPNQKERVVRALRTGGAVVGFFGDGVNDTPAMHAADVSLSVESAVDIAKSTADFVLTSRDLDVVRRGIEHGRRTFANTLKYILTTTSANLGNMISMAVASLVLPFLPLTAGQILLNNFLSDVPAAGIAGDTVDPELVGEPRRWDMRFIGRFMLEFGILSSAFDALTFVILIRGFHTTEGMFRTGWFVESLLTELVIALVVRTRRRAWQSQPGRLLVWSSVAVAALAFTLPYLPIAAWLGFVWLPIPLALMVIAITVAYVVAAELAKSWFYRPERRRAAATTTLPFRSSRAPARSARMPSP